ncbi:hypothetical protein VPH35_027733 [Triticum aestivum]
MDWIRQIRPARASGLRRRPLLVRAASSGRRAALAGVVDRASSAARTASWRWMRAPRGGIPCCSPSPYLNMASPCCCFLLVNPAGSGGGLRGCGVGISGSE